jgi:hypothetical protein
LLVPWNECDADSGTTEPIRPNDFSPAQQLDQAVSVPLDRRILKELACRIHRSFSPLAYAQGISAVEIENEVPKKNSA